MNFFPSIIEWLKNNIPAIILFIWATLTLFGFWDNGDWYWPEAEIWKLIAILVLYVLLRKNKEEEI